MIGQNDRRDKTIILYIRIFNLRGIEICLFWGVVFFFLQRKFVRMKEIHLHKFFTQRE
jgi:hypothetical protein